jgi:hypothetical protein
LTDEGAKLNKSLYNGRVVITLNKYNYTFPLLYSGILNNNNMDHQIIPATEFNKTFGQSTFDSVNISTSAKEVLKNTNNADYLVLVTLEEAESIGCKYPSETGDTDYNQDVENINNILGHALVHDLEGEVMLAALIAMKENPTLSIQNAIQIGFDEWVK